jgi:ribosomal protein L11 methyltransferase
MLRRYRFCVDPELLEALSGCLFARGALGLEEQGATLLTIADDQLGHELSQAYEEFRALARSSFPQFATSPLEVEEVAPDYNALWLSELGPVFVLPGLVFCPTSKRNEAPAGVDTLWFEPQVAFGAGDHPTTRLAARALAREAGVLQSAQRSWNRLLDIGTGTGVLGLVGLWLGAKVALGTDISQAALDSARVNSGLNGFEQRFLLDYGSVPAMERAVSEVVVANIDRATLLGLAPRIAACVSPDGALILTGFLGEDTAEIRVAYEVNGLSVEHSEVDGDWALIQFRRRG